MPPDEALRMLKEGNRRFVKGTPEAAWTQQIKVVGIWWVRTEGRHPTSQFKATIYLYGLYGYVDIQHI